MAAAPRKKTTPSYEHVLDDPYFRKEVYEPEADSFLLLDALDADCEALHAMAAAAEPERGPLLCAELGVGSGIALTHLAMLLVAASDDEPAATPSHEFVAVDVNPRALEATRRTFEASLTPAQRRRAQLSLLRGDLMTPLSMRARFDVLIFNPPYVPTSLDELNAAVRDVATNTSWICAAWAGGPKGRLVVDRVLSVLHLLLRPPGGVAYVIALDENDMPDMVRMAETCSGGCVTGRVVASRWTGERLNVIKFYFRGPQDRTLIPPI